MPITLTQTKHYQATARLRKYILRLPAGDTVPVVADLTAMFDCSHGTAVRALQALADEGLIMRPPRKQRYRVTRHVPCASARIAMVRPDFPSSSIENLQRGIFLQGKSRNWKFSFFSYRNADELDFDRIAAVSDAMVLIPASEEIPQLLIDRMLEMGKPIVVLMEHIDHPAICNVAADDAAFGRLAARKLRQCGYRRVLLIKDQPAESTMALRIAGYRNEAARLGLPVSDELFLDTKLRPFEDCREKLQSGFAEILRSGVRFDAVLCLTMDAAIVVHRLLLASGRRIPQDAGLLAYGGENNIAEFFTPPITTFSIDLDSGMAAAAELLAERLDGQPRPASVRLMTPFLEERETLRRAT